MYDFRQLKYLLKSISNIHIQGDKGNIFLFATPRGGSTWLMEIIASQPGMKYFDEPFNIRRDNVKTVNVFNDWADLMPDSCDKELIIKHLKNLESNKIRHMNPPPFRKNHRVFTSRIVYKIHELEHLIDEIKDEFNGYILYLLRHPIANTISRHVFPRLNYFIDSDFYNDNYLTVDQIQEIRKIIDNGTEFQKGIVSWCYENIIPLTSSHRSDFCFVTYEELLLNPEKTCKLMMEKLNLSDLNSMLKSIGDPAMNIMMSNNDTLDIIKNTDFTNKNLKLVKKWKSRVSEQEEDQAFEILELFGLNAYIKDRFIATDEYLNFKDTNKYIL